METDFFVKTNVYDEYCQDRFFSFKETIVVQVLKELQTESSSF